MKDYTIREIFINNFRVFHDQPILLNRDLTFITGTNGSGKTSFLKTLLLLKESAITNNLDSIDFSTEGINLGTYDSCKTNNSSEEDIVFKMVFSDTSILNIPNRIKILPDSIILCLKYLKDVENGKLISLLL